MIGILWHTWYKKPQSRKNGTKSSNKKKNAYIMIIHKQTEPKRGNEPSLNKWNVWIFCMHYRNLQIADLPESRCRFFPPRSLRNHLIPARTADTFYMMRSVTNDQTKLDSFFIKQNLTNASSAAPEWLMYQIDVITRNRLQW